MVLVYYFRLSITRNIFNRYSLWGTISLPALTLVRSHRVCHDFLMLETCSKFRKTVLLCCIDRSRANVFLAYQHISLSSVTPFVLTNNNRFIFMTHKNKMHNLTQCHSPPRSPKTDFKFNFILNYADSSRLNLTFGWCLQHMQKVLAHTNTHTRTSVHEGPYMKGVGISIIENAGC